MLNMDSAERKRKQTNNHANPNSKLERDSQVDITLLDFAKAFDKVPHHRLLHKLEYYGVNPKTNRWIRSILENSVN